MKKIKQDEKMVRRGEAGLSKILSVVSVDAGCSSRQ